MKRAVVLADSVKSARLKGLLTTDIPEVRIRDRDNVTGFEVPGWADMDKTPADCQTALEKFHVAWDPDGERRVYMMALSGIPHSTLSKSG